jgi:hypothetical protein
MSDDFRKLIEEIEAEAKAEGPSLRPSFGTYGASSPPRPSKWRLRIASLAIILNAAAPLGRKSSQRPSNPSPRE